MELLVVIGIIGILVAIGTVSYSSAQSRSRDARRRTDIETIAKALEQFNASNSGSYPDEVDCAGFEDFLSSSIPTDPKFGYEYTSDANDDGDAGSTYCQDDSFCICTRLEEDGTGNASGKSGTSCTFAEGGNYFCVQHRL